MIMMSGANINENIGVQIWLIPTGWDNTEESFHTDWFEDIWWTEDALSLPAQYVNQELETIVQKAQSVHWVSQHSEKMTNN